MIVTTINVNGIRAAIKQRSEKNLGLLPWLAETKADVVRLHINWRRAGWRHWRAPLAWSGPRRMPCGGRPTRR